MHEQFYVKNTTSRDRKDAASVSCFVFVFVFVIVTYLSAYI